MADTITVTLTPQQLADIIQAVKIAYCGAGENRTLVPPFAPLLGDSLVAALEKGK